VASHPEVARLQAAVFKAREQEAAALAALAAKKEALEKERQGLRSDYIYVIDEKEL
jgi:hypothetical protein